MVIEDYKNGATAKDVAAKWKTSPGSVYRHAALACGGKRAVGDARSRAYARMVEEEVSASNGLHPVGSRALKNLFSPTKVDDPEGGSPAALARMATLASGRAMRGRLWAEARALAALAETYQRLAAREGEGGIGGGGGPGRAGAGRDGAGLTPGTAPLSLILGILEMDGAALGERFAVDPDAGEAQPDYALKRAYWQRRAGQNRWLEAVHFRREALERRVEALEAALVAADLPLPEEHAARRAARLAPD